MRAAVQPVLRVAIHARGLSPITYLGTAADSLEVSSGSLADLGQ
jgi:hypothetical protein